MLLSRRARFESRPGIISWFESAICVTLVESSLLLGVRLHTFKGMITGYSRGHREDYTSQRASNSA